MNPNIEKALIRAETIGMKQGAGTMRNGDCFCFLGMLADYYISQHPNKTKWVPRANGSFSLSCCIEPFTYSAKLPSEVSRFFGRLDQSTVWYLNDRLHLTFRQIAERL